MLPCSCLKCLYSSLISKQHSTIEKLRRSNEYECYKQEAPILDSECLDNLCMKYHRIIVSNILWIVSWALQRLQPDAKNPVSGVACLLHLEILPSTRVRSSIIAALILISHKCLRKPAVLVISFMFCAMPPIPLFSFTCGKDAWLSCLC